MAKKKKSTKNKIDVNKIVNKEIPNEIKILFGKFYLFSFIYIIFFAVIYPFLLLKVITELSSIILFIFLIMFYIYMIIDVKKKKKTYNSTMYMILILLVLVSISFSIVKFFF